MLIYDMWKNLIENIKSGLFEDLDMTTDLFLTIIFSPAVVIVDILISPYSLCYLIVKMIKKKGE